MIYYIAALVGTGIGACFVGKLHVKFDLFELTEEHCND